MNRGMTYAPDYAINGGGLINIYHEKAVPGGYSRTRAFEHVMAIGNTISEILERARATNLPTNVVADQIAEERVRSGVINDHADSAVMRGLAPKTNSNGHANHIQAH